MQRKWWEGGDFISRIRDLFWLAPRVVEFSELVVDDVNEMPVQWEWEPGCRRLKVCRVIRERVVVNELRTNKMNNRYPQRASERYREPLEQRWALL